MSDDTSWLFMVLWNGLLIKLSFVFIDSTCKVVGEKSLKEFEWMKKGHCVKYNYIFQYESHKTNYISKSYFQHSIVTYSTFISRLIYFQIKNIYFKKISGLQPSGCLQNRDTSWWRTYGEHVLIVQCQNELRLWP